MTYNDSIIIQSYTQTRDTRGSIDVGSWATYKTVWAEITDVSGSVTHESDMPIYEDAKSFKFRTFDASAVTTKMRISYDSNVYVIHSIQKAGRLTTTLIASAYDDE